MRYRVFYLLVFSILILLGCRRRYSDLPPDLSIFERITHERTDDDKMEEFIDSLILRLTLPEKIGQMTQLNEAFFSPDDSGNGQTGGKASLIDSMKVAKVIDEFKIGSFLTGGTRTAYEWYEIGDKLQKINMAHAPNRIPIIFGIDYIHGPNYLAEGTIFPQEINLGATFDPSFARQMGSFTSREAASLGHHWNFAPVLGVGLKKLWPRLYETFGEDTYVTSVMGAAYVDGLQNESVGPYHMAACAKHYLGYSIPNSGWDRTPVDISPQKLQELLIPPFKAAIDSGVMTIMVNSGEINGIPVHASYYYLTTVLRDQLGFAGVVLTDYGDIIKLNTEYHVTPNEKESTYKAIIAGIDMSMTPTSTDFCRYLKELVEEGRIPEERIDLSVRRILRLKYILGLFDHPYPSDQYFGQIGTRQAHDASRNAANESIVLMKNERDLLPLPRPNKLVVVGDNADSRMALCGGWTYTWQGNDETAYPDSIKTVVEALKEEYDNSRIVYTTPRGLRWNARTADAVIVVTGEKPYAEGWGNIDDLALPQDDRDLIETAISTDKPVILVLLEGRPRTLGDLYDKCQAVLFAGLPGMFGGEAIAGILKGRINPSAKMPITYPYKSGHIIPYNHKFMEYSDLNIYNPDVQRYTIGEFGTGLSYSRFEYSDLELSDTIINEQGSIKASVRVKNTGQREGKEAVLWFLTDEVATYTRPVKQLKYFEKKFLLPGEIKEYTFTITPKMDLGYPNERGKMILESGYYTLHVGPLESRFKLVLKD